MTHASVFSGIGGPEVAATMLGWSNLFHCEINPFGRAVLDYWYPNAKSYDDITKTDFSEWRGKIDVLTGGFPCQPFSYAGQRRGAEDDRYLWPYMFKCIDTIRPTWVVAENVGGILTMVEQGEVFGVETQGALFGEEDVVRRYELRETFTLERICRDLETHGYAVQPVLVPACAVGAPHRRDRVFIVGRRRDNGECREAGYAEQTESGRPAANAEGNGDSGRPRQVCGAERRPTELNAEPCINGEVPTAAHAVGGGTGASGEGGSVEGDGSDQDKQPCQRGAATEWNSRFYELLRNVADTANDRLQHGAESRGEGCETGTIQGQRNRAERNVSTSTNGNRGTSADTTEQHCERMRLEQPENCRAEQERFGRGGCEDGSRWISTDTDNINVQRPSDVSSDCENCRRQPNDFTKADCKNCCEQYAADTDSLRLHAGNGGDTQGHGRAEDGQPETHDGGLASTIRREWETAESCGDRWRQFPSQSPVHRGNDGLPFPLDDLTLSPAKWRTEALKAYGNAIVPQVMYEIFRAIEVAETGYKNQ